MNIEIEYDVKDKSVLLSALKAGECFHFATTPFNDAINEDAIYIVVSGGKESRVQFANLKDGLLMQRDDCHRVVKIKAKIKCQCQDLETHTHPLK